MNETQLRSCTRRELLALAAKGRVRGRHRMSKDQLIEAIRSRSSAPTTQPERHPSRRSQKKGPPQGERKLLSENNNGTARPEEAPFSGGVSKPALSAVEGGARWEKSTLPEKEERRQVAEKY
jgi:hypothetical protein